MDVALVTAGSRLLTATSFIGMGCIATEKAFQWLTNNPKIVHASTVICRNMDDIVSNEVIKYIGETISFLLILYSYNIYV